MAFRQRIDKIKEGAKKKTKPAGWVLPQEKGALGDDGTW
jgi:NCS1 family nucleobase:cation symporter-1